MGDFTSFKAVGFSQYEAICYMALTGHHPINGSQLSKVSGIARSRIYDVLRSLMAKGYVVEVTSGQYAPLPADELIRRLKRAFSANIEAMASEIEKVSKQDGVEYVWTLTGWDHVMEKAAQMIEEAREEIYVRLFPKASQYLDPLLVKAVQRGVNIRYIAMGQVEKKFDIQVMHPDHHHLIETIGGRSIDVITDKNQALVGIFEKGRPDLSPINWTRNQSFVIANRDSLRHDFYHCFLEKILDRQTELSEDELKIYQIVKNDE